MDGHSCNSDGLCGDDRVGALGRKPGSIIRACPSASRRGARDRVGYFRTTPIDGSTSLVSSTDHNDAASTESGTTELSGETSDVDSSSGTGSATGNTGDPVVCGEGQTLCEPEQVCVEDRCLPGRCQGELVFDDRRLERAVRYGLGDTPPVTMDQAIQLRELDLRGFNDIKFGGIECLVNLNSVDVLQTLTADDLRSPAWLTNVEDLYMVEASEDVLDLISTMMRMKRLIIGNTTSRSLDKLAPLTQLEDLSIQTCEQLSDVSALANFPELRMLRCTPNVRDRRVSLQIS